MEDLSLDLYNHKFPIYLNNIKINHNLPNILNIYFYHLKMCHPPTAGTAQSVDPAQTVPEEQSDQGQPCMLSHVCPKISDNFGILIRKKHKNTTS